MPKASSTMSAARRWPRSSGTFAAGADAAERWSLYPTLIRFGDFEITTFGALVALAAMTGLWIFHRELVRTRARLKPKATDFSPSSGVDAALIGVLGGLAGAKIIWAIEFRHDAPFLSLLLSRGGL